MIPQFPNFKKLELSDKKEIEDFVSDFPPSSAFNFTNLWAWDIRNDRKVSKLNGNLVIMFTNYETKEPFLSFLGENKCQDTLFKLLNFAIKSNISPKLCFITEETIKHIRSDNLLIIEEDTNNYDYLFSTSELACFKGIKFKKHRHLVNQFLQKYPNAEFLIKDLNNLSIKDKIYLVLQQWEYDKKIKNKIYDLRFEEKALCRLLESTDIHNLILSSVFMNNEMLGFSIDEILPNQNAISHFIKADPSFKGIYEFINMKAAHHLMGLNILSWNWQQDLGIENLRKTKLGYRPIGYLKRYTVSMASKSM